MCMLILCVVIVFLVSEANAANRLFCPPQNLVLNSKRTFSGLRTAIIGEVHGQLWIQTQNHPLRWASYFDGNQLARNLYNHVGMLGIDKIYLTVFYNATLYPTPPTIEDIYPSKRYCVSDWYKLGVLDWRPEKYGGPVDTWPFDEHGNRTLNRDYYKTQRGYHPIYEEIRNQTDWIFVLDMDEVLTPINFDTSTRPDWCSANQPPLITRILEQMLSTSTHHVMRTYADIMKTARLKTRMDSTVACPLGLSYSLREQKCRPITAITIPVYLWIRGPHGTLDSMPTIRSIYPAFYAPRLKSGPRDGHEEGWKSVYQTKYNPLLKGMSIHANDVDRKLMFQILAPRAFHGGMSLELVHQRTDNHELTRQNITQLMTSDYRLVKLLDAYHTCMLSLL